jgi:membrane protein
VTSIRERAHGWRERLTGLLSRAPDRPSRLPPRAWWGVITRTVGEFIDDELTDRAAALTYYGILSLFPGLVVLVSLLGVLGRGTTAAVVANIKALTPGPARDIVANGLTDLQNNQGAAGVLAIVGLGLAFWSATGYVGAFMRASNRIYDVPEGRPLWKTIPIQLVVTAVTLVFVVASVLTIFLTGRLAEAAGRVVGVEQEAVRVFDIAKWPVLVVVAIIVLALLYWVAPNARPGGFRWITPGSTLAVLVWVAASAGFAYYVSSFATYNRTYGALGGVIIFLVWLWLTNVAVLAGAEFDAELSRARAMVAGLPADTEPYVPLRDLPRRPSQPTAAPHGEVPPDLG